MEIQMKAKIIDATRDYGDSLSGVLALQRKLGTMEREINAIKAKIDALRNFHDYRYNSKLL